MSVLSVGHTIFNTDNRFSIVQVERRGIYIYVYIEKIRYSEAYFFPGGHFGAKIRKSLKIVDFVILTPKWPLGKTLKIGLHYPPELC